MSDALRTTRENLSSGLSGFVSELCEAMREIMREGAAEAYAKGRADEAARKETAALSVAETAKMLGVARSTLWKWEKSGYLVPAKVGRKVLYKRGEVERILTKAGRANN